MQQSIRMNDNVMLGQLRKQSTCIDLWRCNASIIAAKQVHYTLVRGYLLVSDCERYRQVLSV